MRDVQHYQSQLVRTLIPAISVLVIVLAANLSASGDDPPQLGVYSMDLDGSNLKKVAQATERKWHAAPTWSNDGQFILFHAHVKDAETQDSHLFKVRADGTDIKDLGAGAFATWSPDDKQILFSIPDQHKDQGQAGVWVMNADGKGREWLFAGNAPRFSPDGSKILFVSHHEGNQSIYVYDLLDGMSKKILQEPYQKQPGNAVWSPDSKRVAFIDERTGKSELILIDATGNAEVKPVIRFRGLIGGPPAWSPSGKLTFWLRQKETSDPQRLQILDANSEDPPATLSQQGEGTLNFDPVWSSDGQRLLFISDRH